MKIQSILISLFGIVTLAAQETSADPKAQAPACLSVCYEDFSVPLAMAATLQREQPTDAALYAKLLEALGKDSVRQETFTVLSARSGQHASSGSITEIICPRAYEPARILNYAAVPSTDKDGKVVPGTPVSVTGGITGIPAIPKNFESRSAGSILEISTTLGRDLRVAEIWLAQDHVTLVGKNTAGQELNTTEMPIFETQSLKASAKVKLDEPSLVGTVSRPPASKQDTDSANRVWFAFVTVTLPK